MAALYGREAGLSDEISDLRQQKSAVRRRIAETFERYLPSGRQRYGTFKWSARHQGLFISIEAEDGRGQKQIAGQILYHTDLDEKYKAKYGGTCLGMPARRSRDRWVWVLVGNTEIRIFPAKESLQTDKAMDGIIRSFDLTNLRKL